MTTFEEATDYWRAIYWLSELAGDEARERFVAVAYQVERGLGEPAKASSLTASGLAAFILIQERMKAALAVWNQYPQTEIPRLKALGGNALQDWDTARTEAANQASSKAARAAMDRQIAFIKTLGYVEPA